MELDSSAPPPPPTDIAASGPILSPRYLSLDGLRGLAALYVCLHHIAVISDYRGAFLERGWAAVLVFFALSGFVLTLPMARASGEVRGGVGLYAVRRSVRILPPYYAALAFAYVMIPAIPAGSLYLGHVLPIDAGCLLGHLGLVHNLRSDWYFKYNPAFWSIAFEWQFYVLLPLVFLPIWRRAGSLPICAFWLALSVAPEFFPRQHAYAPPTSAFCLGMAAAGVVAKAERFGPFLVLVACYLGLSRVSHSYYNLAYALTATGSALAIVGLCRWHDSRIAKVLGGRVMSFLGDISYSLYLTHYPIVALMIPRLAPTDASPAARLRIGLTLALPACLAFGWLFHLAVERPCLRLLASDRLKGRPARGYASAGAASE